jgi:hypothetical protein
MKNVKKNCLRCKFYRLKDVDNGICRVDKEIERDYPTKLNEDNCSRWKDSGQQYFIRVGWIKAQKAEDRQEN